MHLVYSDEKEPFNGRPIPYHRQDANKAWLRHTGNLFYLQFIERSTSNFAERRQAAKEIAKCQEIIARWQRHVNWSAEGVADGLAKLKKDWGVQ
jgi:hypothetical protein